MRYLQCALMSFILCAVAAFGQTTRPAGSSTEPTGASTKPLNILGKDGRALIDAEIASGQDDQIEQAKEQLIVWAHHRKMTSAMWKIWEKELGSSEHYQAQADLALLGIEGSPGTNAI